MSELGIFTTDQQLIVRTWDAWIEAATGIPHGRAVGRPLTEVVSDLEARGLLSRFREALSAGTVQVLAPSFHHYLIRCSPRVPSAHFQDMQQRVTIGPLRDGDRITGAIVAIEDVTARLDQERALAAALSSADPDVRREASDAVAAAARIESPAAFVPALTDPNWRVRQAAVQGLARNHDAEFMLSVIDGVRRDHRHFGLLSSALKLLAITEVDVAEPLIALLGDEDPDLRIQAALALGEQQDPRVIGALVRALGDADVNVRFQAIESLGRLRAAAAVDDLLAIVHSRDFFLAFPALDALGAIGDRRVGPDLAPLLDDEQLRVPVADALASLGDDRSIRPLVESLNRSAAAAISIASAIVHIHDRYEHQYKDGLRVSDLVREGLGDRGRSHVVAAVAAASAEQLPILVRVLGWLDGDDVVRALTALLGDDAARAEVIEALVRHGEGVVDAVLDQLDADDDGTRRAAIVALGRLGSRRATARLVAMLDEMPLLVPLAGALALIGDPAASDALLPLLGHPDTAVRQAVIGALNSIGHPQLPHRIAALLTSDAPLVRESAVRIAGYFGYPQTLDQLFVLTDDREEIVRAAAVEHLAFVEDPRALPRLLTALDADTARIRAAAARALARIDAAEAREALVGALYDADPWVRYYATRAIADQRHASAIGNLTRLARADAAPHVRIAALDAIGVLAVSTAIDVVKPLTADQHADVAAAALATLGHLQASEGLSELQEAVRAPDLARRLAAVRGLAAHGSAGAVGSLEWAALTDDDDRVVEASIAALEAVATREDAAGAAAVESLVRMLGETARRNRAATALAGLPLTRLEDVARALQHPAPEVRCAVVDVIGRFQHPDATARVARALTDQASAVRETALSTLQRLGARGLDDTFAAMAAADPSKRVRRAAAAALAHSRSWPD